MIVGLAAAMIDLIFGVIYGGVMGFFGGRIDTVMNKFSEILYSIPYLLVVIMLLVVFEPSLWTIILALTITGWINMSWIVRGEIMQLKTVNSSWPHALWVLTGNGCCSSICFQMQWDLLLLP